MKKQAIQILLLTIIYIVAARFGLLFSYPGTNASPIWLPTGIAISAVLIYGYRIWPGIALGAFAVNLFFLVDLSSSIPISIAISLGTSIGNTLEALLAVYLIRRYTKAQNIFEKTSDIISFIIYGAFLATILSAFIGTLSLCLSTGNWSDFAKISLTWWMGDATGTLLLVPVFVTYQRANLLNWKFNFDSSKKLLFILGLMLMAYIIFILDEPLIYLIIPVLVFAAFYISQFELALTILFLAFISSYSTISDIGPFAGSSRNEALLMQQFFLGSISITTMILAALISSQRKAEKKLKSEMSYSQNIINTSSAIIVGLDKNHIIRLFNQGAEKITSYSKEEVLGKDWFKIFFPSAILDEMNKVWSEAWGISSHSYENIILTKTREERVISFQTTGFYEDEDVEKHMLISIGEDISDRKKAENQLVISTKRFSDLFENAPVSLWEEDFTELANYLEEQINIHKKQPEILFEEHPEILFKCSELVKVIDVNKQTLKLFEASSKEELLGNLDKTFTKESPEAFKQSILAFHTGNTNSAIEAKNISIKGKELDVLLQWSKISAEEELKQRILVSVFDMSEIHKIEKDLIASEERFRAMYENNHTVMALLDPESGKIIDANPAAVNYYGYSRDKFINELYIYDLNTLSKEDLVKRMDKAKANKQTFYNFKHRLSDGQIRNIETYSGPISFDGRTVLFSIIHDVTEKMQAENELETSKSKLESILRAAPTGIGVVENRIITETNQSFCKMLGYSQEDLLGKESIMLYPSREEFEWVGKEKYEQIQKTGTGTVETKLKHKDGHILDILLSSTPIDLKDLSKGVTFTALDITQRKKDVDELYKHRNNLEEIIKERTSELENSQIALLNLVDDVNQESEKLDQANKDLANINEELETFTYSVSHDLKAPLRGIDGYSHLLLSNFEKEMDPEARVFLNNIRKSTKQMNVLIEDLLAYSRMERKDFRNEDIHFESLINDLLLHYSASIEANNVKIKLSFPKKLKLKADKDGVNLVLRNLLDNALKFTSDKENAQIEISCSENSDNWHLFVKDNGIGFDMKYHDRIYKIFQRLHLAEEYEGTGVGLAMVSKAVQRMNGKIWAESTLDKGTSFHIELYKSK